MSELNDPRVLFAAERTLLAWSRTSAGLMAFGFLVDRAGLVINGPAAARDFGFWIGLAFILVGVLVCPLSVVQYHRSIAQLRQVEIPPGYWVNLSTFMSIAIGLLGLALAIYLVVAP
jgi:putative membrane protein